MPGAGGCSCANQQTVTTDQHVVVICPSGPGNKGERTSSFRLKHRPVDYQNVGPVFDSTTTEMKAAFHLSRVAKSVLMNTEIARKGNNALHSRRCRIAAAARGADPCIAADRRARSGDGA
jgi:hypothetical protein